MDLLSTQNQEANKHISALGAMLNFTNVSPAIIVAMLLQPQVSTFSRLDTVVPNERSLPHVAIHRLVGNQHASLAPRAITSHHPCLP